MTTDNLWQLIGIPFKQNGRDANGLDCWGLVCLFYKEYRGIVLPPYTTDYAGVWDAAGLEAVRTTEQQQWRRVDVKNALYGDVLLFRIASNIFHVGVHLERGRMLHAIAGTNSVIERYDSPLWNKRLEQVYRYQGQSLN